MSVRPSARQSVSPLYNQWAYVDTGADNCADAVDRSAFNFKDTSYV